MYIRKTRFWKILMILFQLKILLISILPTLRKGSSTVMNMNIAKVNDMATSLKKLINCKKQQKSWLLQTKQLQIKYDTYNTAQFKVGFKRMCGDKVHLHSRMN